jgi:hypothetical protein
VPGHGSADEAIALALLILGPPDFTQLVSILLSFNFLLRQFSLVSLAATPRGFSNFRSCPFSFFSFLVHHISLLAILDGDERFGPAAIPEALFNEGGIEALVFDDLFDSFNVFVLLVGRSVLLEGVLLSEDVFLAADFLEGLLNISLDQGLFLF